MMFSIFPRQIACGTRSISRDVVYSMKEMLDAINTSNGKVDCYVSLYPFNNDGTIKLIDKIYIDIDSTDMEKVRSASLVLEQNNISYAVFFSGRHFNIYIFCKIYFPKYTKSCLYNTHKKLKEMGIENDPHIVGDVMRISRVPNTMNMKTKRYCIPLLKEDLKKSYDEIFELAKNQRFISNVNNGNLFDLNPFDYDSRKEFNGQNNNMELLDIESDFNFNFDSVPRCIRNILQNREMTNRQRFYVILWLKERGYLYSDVVRILQQFLSPQKFQHCVYEERQVTTIYSRDSLIFSCPEGGVHCDCNRRLLQIVQ